MKAQSGNAALLIDLENFYLGRESVVLAEGEAEEYDFAADLELLCAFAERLADGRRLAVRRAYANFNAWRPGSGVHPRDFFLQPQARFLMEQGVEPVQVFRFPGGGNKNATDMRMAMDATALLTEELKPELYVLVTGDADFIPLSLELMRRGVRVHVIAVRGSAKLVFQKYCDRFEYFEDLLAERELLVGRDEELDALGRALHGVLERREAVRVAGVKPLLSNELGRAFDPQRFDCDSTSDFLRKFGPRLGVSVVHHPGGDIVQLASGSGQAASATGPEPASTAARVSLYREVLRYGQPRLYVLPLDEWQRITSMVFERAAMSDGERPSVLHGDLLDEITDICRNEGMERADGKVSSALFQLFKAGCFLLADQEAEDRRDFHWSRPAVLDPGIQDVQEMRSRVRHFLVETLRRRLARRGMAEELDDAALDALFNGSSERASVSSSGN